MELNKSWTKGCEPSTHSPSVAPQLRGEMSITSIVRTAAALLLVLALGGLSAVTASASTTRTISGTATCANGHAVVGIWVESKNSGSGWADTTTTFVGQTNNAYFTKKITTGAASIQIKLDIGCGGSTKTWWSSNSTPFISITGNRTLNTECKEQSGSGAQRCTWPPKGSTVSSNLGVGGQCTWGALEKWKGATGYYPRTAGNAKDWDNNAPGFGWRLSRVPAVRSFIIFETPPTGHVAWVIGVKHVGGGQFDVTYIEMNGSAGPWNYQTTTIRHKKGTHDYILATL